MKRLMIALLAMFLPVPVLAAESSSTTPATIDDVLEELDELRGEVGLSAQIAIVMTIPVAESMCNMRNPRPICPVNAYLLGSTIDGFPIGTVHDSGYIMDTKLRLPEGTFLVEVHQPRSDKLICHGSNSAAYGIRTESNRLFTHACPHLTAGVTENRVDSGSRIFTVGAGRTLELRPWTRIPRDLFGNTEEHRSYTGSIKITRLR